MSGKPGEQGKQNNPSQNTGVLLRSGKQAIGVKSPQKKPTATIVPAASSIASPSQTTQNPQTTSTLLTSPGARKSLPTSPKLISIPEETTQTTSASLVPLIDLTIPPPNQLTNNPFKQDTKLTTSTVAQTTTLITTSHQGVFNNYKPSFETFRPPPPPAITGTGTNNDINTNFTTTISTVTQAASSPEKDQTTSDQTFLKTTDVKTLQDLAKMERTTNDKIEEILKIEEELDIIYEEFKKGNPKASDEYQKKRKAQLKLAQTIAKIQWSLEEVRSRSQGGSIVATAEQMAAGTLDKRSKNAELLVLANIIYTVKRWNEWCDKCKNDTPMVTTCIQGFCMNPRNHETMRNERPIRTAPTLSENKTLAIKLANPDNTGNPKSQGSNSQSTQNLNKTATQINAPIKTTANNQNTQTSGSSALKPPTKDIAEQIDDNVFEILEIQQEILQLQIDYEDDDTSQAQYKFDEAREKQFALANAIAKLIADPDELILALQGLATAPVRTWFEKEGQYAETHILGRIIKDEKIGDTKYILHNRFTNIEDVEICSNSTWLRRQLENIKSPLCTGRTMTLFKGKESEQEEEEETEAEKLWNEALLIRPDNTAEPVTETQRIQTLNNLIRKIVLEYGKTMDHTKKTELEAKFIEKRQEQITAASKVVAKIAGEFQIEKLLRWEAVNLKMQEEPWINNTTENEAIMETLLQLAVPGEIRNQIEEEIDFMEKWFDIDDEEMFKEFIPMNLRQVQAGTIKKVSIDAYRLQLQYLDETDEEQKINLEEEFQELRRQQMEMAKNLDIRTVDDILQLTPNNISKGYTRDLGWEGEATKAIVIIAMLTSNWTAQMVNEEKDLPKKVKEWADKWNKITELTYTKGTGGILYPSEILEIADSSPDKNPPSQQVEGFLPKLRRASYSAIGTVTRPIRRLSQSMMGSNQLNSQHNTETEIDINTMNNDDKVAYIRYAVNGIRSVQEEVIKIQHKYPTSDPSEQLELQKEFEYLRRQQNKAADEIANMVEGPLHLAEILLKGTMNRQFIMQTWKEKGQSLAAMEVLANLLIDCTLNLKDTDKIAKKLSSITDTEGWGESWIEREIRKLIEEEDLHQTILSTDEKITKVRTCTVEIARLQKEVAKRQENVDKKTMENYRAFKELRMEQKQLARTIAEIVADKEQLALIYATKEFDEEQNKVSWKTKSGENAEWEVLESILMKWELQTDPSLLKKEFEAFANYTDWGESWIIRRVQEIENEQNYLLNNNQTGTSTPEEQIGGNYNFYSTLETPIIGQNNTLMNKDNQLNRSPGSDQTYGLKPDDPDWINKWQKMAKQDLARRDQKLTYTPSNPTYTQPPVISWDNNRINQNIYNTKKITNPKKLIHYTSRYENKPPITGQNKTPITKATGPNNNKENHQTLFPIPQTTPAKPKKEPTKQILPSYTQRTINRLESNRNLKQQAPNETITVLVGQNQQQQQVPVTTQSNRRNERNNNNRRNNRGGGNNNNNRRNNPDPLLNDDGIHIGAPFYSYDQMKEMLELLHPQKRPERIMAPLPKFKGINDDPWEWWSKYNEIAAINGISDERRLEMVILSLEGRAKQWYDGEKEEIAEWEPSPDHIIDSSFKTAFEKRFCNRDVQRSYMEQLQSKVQGQRQDVEEYAYEVQDLAKRADPTNEYPDWQLLEIFLKGLTPQIQMQVRLMGSYDTFGEAVEVAKKVERTFNITNKNMKGGYHAGIEQVLAAELSEVKRELKKMTTPFQSNNNNATSCALCYASNPNHTTENCPNRSMNRNFNTGTYCNICRSREHMAQHCPKKNLNSQTVMCYRCQGQGHIARDCPKSKQTTECFSCGRKGHMAKECRQGLKCTNCDRFGHIAKDCRSNRTTNYQNDQRNISNQNDTDNRKCTKCGNFGHNKDKCNAKSCDFCHQLGHLEEDCFALKRKLANWQKNPNNKNGFNNRSFIATTEEQEQPDEMKEQITSAITKSVADIFKNINLKD
jgi:cellular nucleic acid-binding protein